MKRESIELKWGTLKGWSDLSEKSISIVQRWANLGYSFSAMGQRDTPEQKDILCELIDAIDGEIINDWTGEKMSKNEAKKYVREYR
jgi:hypothetical protein